MSVRRMSLRVTRSPDVEGLLGVTGANTGNREDDDKLFNYLLGRLQAWGHAFSNAPTQMRADYLSWKKDTDRKDKVISSFDNFDAVADHFTVCTSCCDLDDISYADAFIGLCRQQRFISYPAAM